MTDALPCLACGMDLLGHDSRSNHPSGGTEFVARGHYGSGVHDPMDGSMLAINICDGCLFLAQANNRVGKYIPNRDADRPRDKLLYVPPE
jgi:hypothetical protein